MLLRMRMMLALGNAARTAASASALLGQEGLHIVGKGVGTERNSGLDSRHGRVLCQQDRSYNVKSDSIVHVGLIRSRSRLEM